MQAKKSAASQGVGALLRRALRFDLAQAREGFRLHRSTRVLSAFPNAVAITGHSHMPLTDDLAVWRGAFTSVAAASLSYGFWPETPERTERSRAAAVGFPGGIPFAQGLLVDVFADRFELRARDFARNEPIDAPQILPIASAPC